MPSRADQSEVSPSQPVRSLPLKRGTNPAVSTSAGSPSSSRDPAEHRWSRSRCPPGSPRRPAGRVAAVGLPAAGDEAAEPVEVGLLLEHEEGPHDPVGRLEVRRRPRSFDQPPSGRWAAFRSATIASFLSSVTPIRSSATALPPVSRALPSPCPKVPSGLRSFCDLVGPARRSRATSSSTASSPATAIRTSSKVLAFSEKNLIAAFDDRVGRRSSARRRPSGPRPSCRRRACRRASGRSRRAPGRSTT